MRAGFPAQDYRDVIPLSATGEVRSSILAAMPNSVENPMRHALAFALALTALVAPAAFAGSDHAGHTGMAAKQAGLTDGVVKKVDKAAGKITLSHGPLENLGMPGMTMAFSVKDAAWLDRFKAGDKVRFLAELVNGSYTVVRIDPAM